MLINIFARSFFFRSFSYQFRSIFVFQHFSEFLSAISQKFKQESKEIYFLYGENIIFIQVFFSICCIVPLFYTEKGNYVSLTRFALRFSDFFFIYFCIMHTCNHVLYVCVSKCLFSFIHNREKGFLSTNDDVLSLVSSLKLLSQCLH